MVRNNANHSAQDDTLLGSEHPLGSRVGLFVYVCFVFAGGDFCQGLGEDWGVVEAFGAPEF